MWDRHYCPTFTARLGPLADRINAFASYVRDLGARVIHCPSGTVDTHYVDWPQRQRIALGDQTPEPMIPVSTPLSYHGECLCDVTCQPGDNGAKQHDAIRIDQEDVITDRGNEVRQFLETAEVTSVLMTGVALNMCVVSRPFGIASLVAHGITVRVVGDLVDVLYSPSQSPYLDLDAARWFVLGYIHATLCPAVTVKSICESAS